MDGWFFIVAENLLVAILAFMLGYIAKKYLVSSKIRSAGTQAEKLLEEARTKCIEIELEAKSEAIKIRDEAEKEFEQRRRELRRQEQKVNSFRDKLEHRQESIENRGRNLDKLGKQAEKLKGELEELRERQVKQLEETAALSQEAAREVLLKSVERDSRAEMARVIRQVEAEAKEEADRKAREIVTLAIQRCASEQVAETTVSTVDLPGDDMKGRIIGRGGRNIRAIEKATGVDLVVDDTPEAVILSCFDPVRREVARIALTRLVMDGRIHPARIEKVVSKAQQEVDAIIKEEGEKVAYEAGVHNLHPELIRLLGRLKFRTSYGQNMLQHSLDSAYLAAMMAGELGADVQLAREAGLLHDIGKAVDHEMEGSHAAIGAEILRRLNADPRIINAVAFHHGDEEPQTIEAILVQAADAISGARPGARRETLESYIKRIEELEKVAESFDGVENVYAIQAGREIRVMVKPGDIDDLAAIQLSRDIAKDIESNLTYPGQIKVTVIRETRFVDYAK